MQPYKITALEQKTSAKGAVYYKVTLENAQGQEIHDVTIFSSFKGNIALNSVLEGILKPNEYKGKTSYVLEGGNLGPRPAYAQRTNQIASAVKVKAESIKEAGERKAEGIMVSATMRDAVLIVTSRNSVKDATDEHIENEIMKWRQWLIAHWDV